MGVGGGGWGSCQWKPKYLVPIKYPVHELLGIITRFLFGFIKRPALLKTSVLKKTFFRLRLKLQIIKLATNNYLIITFHMEKCF